MNHVPQFRFKKIRLAILTGMVVSFPFFQNCSGVGFEKSTDSSSAQAAGDPTQNSCNNTQLQTSTTPIKVLFVVDTSGSNAGDATHTGTDMNKSIRAGSIQAFFSDFGAKANFNWGFITFQGLTATAILNAGNNGSVPEFTNSASLMQSAINYFKTSIPDQSVTPYQAAIQMAHTAIINDGGDTAATKYIIVFLSDGMPTDYPDTTAGDTQIANDISSLIGLKPGRISFNSIYYGPTDADASGRLQMMANSGHGQFLDTNANPSAKDFLINNVVTVPGTNCAGN